MRWLKRFLAVIVVLLALFAVLWVVADQLRQQRESMSVEDLAPKGGQWVTAGDADLFVQQWGAPDAPMLLLSHGTGAWSGTWFELADALARAGWHVVATDLPPFGFSRTHLPSAAADYTRAAQARRLLALIDTFGAHDVTLVGHSFGAGPALEAALLDPADTPRLRQLILIDPALGLGSRGERPHCAPTGLADTLLARRDVRTVAVGAIVTQPRFTRALLSQFVHRREAVTDERVPAYQRPFARTGFSAALGDWAHTFARASCEDATSLNPEALTAWSARNVPVKLLWGEQDTVTPIAQSGALRQWMPHAQLTVIPGVGHIPHIEAPEAFARALIEVAGPPR